MFREHFARALAATIQGTISAPPGVYGETLESEQLRGGSFLGSVGETAGMNAEQWDLIVDRDVGNSNARLFGGAQYHRALREFAIAVQHMGLPEVRSGIFKITRRATLSTLLHPAPPCPTLPHPAPPCPTLPHSTLSRPTCSNPTQPYPTLPNPALTR